MESLPAAGFHSESDEGKKHVAKGCKAGKRETGPEDKVVKCQVYKSPPTFRFLPCTSGWPVRRFHSKGAKSVSSSSPPCRWRRKKILESGAEAHEDTDHCYSDYCYWWILIVDEEIVFTLRKSTSTVGTWWIWLITPQITAFKIWTQLIEQQNSWWLWLWATFQSIRHQTAAAKCQQSSCCFKSRRL